MEGTGTNILLSQKGKSSSILMLSLSIRIYAHGVFFYELASLGKECPNISVLLGFFNIVQKRGGGDKVMLENCRIRKGLKLSTKYSKQRGGGGGQRIF